MIVPNYVSSLSHRIAVAFLLPTEIELLNFAG